jgi:putative ABC transport system substrate-binding protein
MTVTIGRRELLVALGGAAAWPLAARAQQGDRMRRIGIVMPFAKGDSEGEARIRAFKQELAKLGWTDTGNIQFDERWPADNMDDPLARSLTRRAARSELSKTVGCGEGVIR